jgi:hypothetical protein
MMRGFLIVLSVLCGIIGMLFWLPGCLVAVVFAVWAMLCTSEKEIPNPPILTVDIAELPEVKELRQRIADLERQAAAKGRPQIW